LDLFTRLYRDALSAKHEIKKCIQTVVVVVVVVVVVAFMNIPFAVAAFLNKNTLYAFVHRITAVENIS